MELLRLAPVAVEEPPPMQWGLARISLDPKSVLLPVTPLAIAAGPLAPPTPFVVKLPSRTEALTVEEGLQALARVIETRIETERLAGEEADRNAPKPRASLETLLRLEMPASAVLAPGTGAGPKLTGPVFSAQPRIPVRQRVRISPTKLRRPARVEFFFPRPFQAGARILKQQPLSAPWPPTPAVRPEPLSPEARVHHALYTVLFPIAPFRKVVQPAAEPGRLSRSGQHIAVGQVRWEFLHELEEIPERLRKEKRADPTRIQRDSVEPWLVPPRPVQPEFAGELRPFDWAQLIARLADFETDPSTTGKHGATTRQAIFVRQRAERLRAIPVIGPFLHFWRCQTWAVRGLALAIPVLAFIAIKPSLDGSLREPVVLAKEMPPASSTVVRLEPSKKYLPAAPIPPRETPVEPQLPAAQDGTAVPAAPPDAKPGPHPKLVPERNARGTKPGGELPIAVVEPKLDQFDRILLSRAAIELADDFSYGLDSWESKSNSVQWSYDSTGFIRPKGLALYRPSMNLADYTVEFLAKIDNSAISWVVRAQDLNNYHVVKLVQRGGGPLPRYTVMRYAVVNGREGPRIEHPLPLNLYKDTLFRVRMDIRGPNFAVIVQDSVVDSWSDDRFPTGGVGFFTGLGEDARIRWVQVTYQNDFLGRICAWLAPKTS